MNLSAEIAVPLSIFKTFDYRVKDEHRSVLETGMRVLIPFGNKKIAGYVISTSLREETSRLKEIEEIIDEPPLFNEDDLKLLRWISNYYAAPIGEVIKLLALRSSLARLDEKVSITVKGMDLLKTDSVDVRTRAILEALLDKKSILLNSLKKICGKNFSYILINYLKECGFITLALKVRKVKVKSKSLDVGDIKEEKRITPTPHQHHALEMLKAAISSGKFSPFLLNGVTGSGKTFVYIEAVKHALFEGKSAIVMVPEISLTPQLISRFSERLGGCIAVIHSGLTESVKRGELQRIKSGNARVVIGARSAIFAPLHDIGLIVVDEEHESFYKQDDGVRYNARDIAIYMGKIRNFTVILGSATPSVESFYNAETGKYVLLNLPERVEEAVLPEVKIIDLKNEEKGAIFSKELLLKIGEKLSKNEQVILFLNRKGFSTYLLCMECGFTFTCPKCSVALTYHKLKDIFKCSYCAKEMKGTEICPACKGKSIKRYGFGTEKVESEIKSHFPLAGIARFDSDTAANYKKGSEILKSFHEGKTDILCGTQLVAKGHHFPEVTLVGVLNADISMQFPDFRASERTFQLITQVSGRSGRGGKKGEVLVQTFYPAHFSIEAAKKGDYLSFYKKEISIRRNLKYPPFTRIAVVRVSARDEKLLWKVANEAASVLKETASGGISVLGPSYCPVLKINNLYRCMILIKSATSSALVRLINENAERVYSMGYKKGIKIAIDVDPQNML